MTLQDVLDRLDGVKRNGDKYTARCPAHHDSNPSLSVSVGNDGRILLHCFAGCSAEDVAGAIGLTMKDLFAEVTSAAAFPPYPPSSPQYGPIKEAEYIYAGGTLKKIKMRKPDGGKFCYWQHLDGNKWKKGRGSVAPGLYQSQPDLPEIFFLVEGEKDVDNLRAAGMVAVSLPDGAQSKWESAYNDVFRDKQVIILPDNDEPGKKYAGMCAEKCYSAGAAVKLLNLADVWPEMPPKADVSDLIAQFGQSEAMSMIITLANDAAPWEKERKGRKAKDAADFPDEDVQFLWYPYLPIGDYSVMMADGGTGKTLLCCGIAAAISTGRRLPGMEEPGQPKTVLIISAEDTGSELKKRLKKSGADLHRVKLIDAMDSVGLSITDDYEEFSGTIREYDPDLVILDPWHAFLGASVDMNRTNALRPILQKSSNIAKENSCAMLLISHVNKRAQGENVNNAATGSADFINAARSAIRVIFDETDENGRIMVHTKSNYAPYGRSVKYRIDDSGVVWNGYSDITRNTLETAARKHTTPGGILEAAERKESQNNAPLIAALKESATPFAPVRFTYEEFKKKYGPLIFGVGQPKKALDAVKGILSDDGYFLKTGIGIRRGNAVPKGFAIQQIDTNEPEQTSIEE